MEAFVEAFTAGVGSAVSKLAIYPLDLLKTRQAVAAPGTPLSSVVKQLTATGGVAGLYKGIQPKLVKSVTGKVLYFYIYRSLLDAYRAANKSNSVGTVANLIIGYLGEALELPVIMPLEAVVSRVQASDSNAGGVAVAKQMFREGGLKKFYVSLDAYLVGAVQPAVQFTLFDQIRAMTIAGRVKRGLSGADLELSTLHAFLLGVVASAVAATLVFPVDMVRTLVQSGKKSEKEKETDEVDGDNKSNAGRENNGLISVATQVVRDEGVLGLYKGLGPHLAQQVLSASLMLMVKERLYTITRRLLVMLVLFVRGRGSRVQDKEL